MKKIYTAIFLLLFSAKIFSQGFTRYDSIPVYDGTDTLLFPWYGGLNYGQMYRIDIDGDGLKDLFVFDKSSTKWRTHINTGMGNLYSLKYEPQYEFRFPGPFSTWVQLFDFNCDGKEDIFTYDNTTGFVKVWKNEYSVATGLNFSLYMNPLQAFYPSSGYGSIMLSNQTHPAFNDIDNDGDLDMLVYGIDVDFYQNMAQENFGTCDTLVLEFADDCWGEFASNGNPMWNTLTFGISCRSNMGWRDSTEMLHVGQSILAIDLDGDFDKDVLIGDVIQNNITEVTNCGTVAVASMCSQDTAFPVYNVPVSETNSNVCDYLDIDNDGVKDLIVQPFAASVSDNFYSSWFYKNLNTTDSANFSLQMKNYFQGEMIETGEGCNPVWFDYDSDGKMDLLIGNYGYWAPQDNNGFESDISLYKNTGTTTAPRFNLISRDFGGVDTIDINNAHPTFGDLDGDLDADMLVGEETGHLIYFDNTAGPGNPAVFNFIPGYYQSIDVGWHAAPQLIDADRDGDLDLIIGGQNGKLAYYQNTGTVAAPVFSVVTTSLGGVDVRKIPSFTGYSVPCMFDSAGAYKLIVGSENGYLYYYTNIDGNLSGNFTLADSMYWDIWEGVRTVPYVADINGDSLFDLVVGNYSGGVSFYKGDLFASIHDVTSGAFEMNIFPNPSNGNVTISFNSGFRVNHAEFVVYSILGEEIIKTEISKGIKSFTFDTSLLPAGIYLCGINLDGKVKMKKLIIAK